MTHWEKKLEALLETYEEAPPPKPVKPPEYPVRYDEEFTTFIERTVRPLIARIASVVERFGRTWRIDDEHYPATLQVSRGDHLEFKFAVTKCTSDGTIRVLCGYDRPIPGHPYEVVATCYDAPIVEDSDVRRVDDVTESVIGKSFVRQYSKALDTLYGEA